MRRCETPKSPPGDYNLRNPLQMLMVAILCGVKHLNPRQGITTVLVAAQPVAGSVCETPKSPPGDYNLYSVVKAKTAAQKNV